MFGRKAVLRVPPLDQSMSPSRQDVEGDNSEDRKHRSPTAKCQDVTYDQAVAVRAEWLGNSCEQTTKDRKILGGDNAEQAADNKRDYGRSKGPDYPLSLVGRENWSLRCRVDDWRSGRKWHKKRLFARRPFRFADRSIRGPIEAIRAALSFTCHAGEKRLEVPLSRIGHEEFRCRLRALRAFLRVGSRGNIPASRTSRARPTSPFDHAWKSAFG
jgi:hypothetical protein